MDFVARAKAVFGSKVRTGALLVLPLAAAVPHAQALTQAGVSLPTSSGSCALSGSGALVSGSCSEVDSQLSLLNGLAGVKFFLSSPFTLQFGSSGGENVTLSSDGTLGGIGTFSSGSSISEHYDFSLSTSPVSAQNPVGVGNTGIAPLSWQLTYSIFDVTTDTSIVNDNTMSGSGAGTFSGFFADTTAGAMSAGDTVLVSTAIALNSPANTNVTLTVPSSSLDVNQSATPEPSTLSFGALGLAIAGIWRGLRRRRTAE